jgi:hypothetical protein|tara:strand:+ start:538 stop:750 length:213 start_codon:yes stop_codon:yes gene_type:complete
MNDISVFIYLMGFCMVFGMTLVYGYMMMRSTLREFDKPTKKFYNIHPEMDDVKDGTELLVFKPSPDEEKD